jgi:hypothetical protein
MVTNPLATGMLESAATADTVTVPEAEASTGTEITITGNPASCPMPLVADVNCTTSCAPIVVASPPHPR